MTNCMVPLVGLLCAKNSPVSSLRGSSMEEPVRSRNSCEAQRDGPGPGRQGILGSFSRVCPAPSTPLPLNYTSGRARLCHCPQRCCGYSVPWGISLSSPSLPLPSPILSPPPHPIFCSSAHYFSRVIFLPFSCAKLTETITKLVFFSFYVSFPLRPAAMLGGCLRLAPQGGAEASLPLG